ncbi:MAG: MarR family transcriptional regulator [Acidobacteriota bacterium]
MTCRDRSASGEAVTLLILQAFEFNGLLASAGDELTKPWGLSSARWKVLGAIARADRSLHVAQIARNMGLTRQAVQRIVNSLVDQGLLALSDNPDHQRARLVRLTQRGRKVYGEIMEEQVRWSNELAEGINPRDLESARRVMVTLCERLE